MAPITAQQTYTMFGSEGATYGTPVSVTKDLGLIDATFTLDDDVDENSQWNMGSSNMSVLDWGRYNAAVKFDGALQHGRIFDFLWGGTTTHAQTTSDWRHTFVLADTLPSMTLEAGHDLATDAVSTY